MMNSDMVYEDFTIKHLCEKAYENAVVHGFWEGCDNPKSNDTVAMKCVLIHTEVSELFEAARSGTLDHDCGKTLYTKSIGLTNLEEELADIVIRVADFAQACGVDLQ